MECILFCVLHAYVSVKIFQNFDEETIKIPYIIFIRDSRKEYPKFLSHLKMQGFPSESNDQFL